MTNTAAPAARTITRTPAQRAWVLAGIRSQAALKGITAAPAVLTAADRAELLAAGDYTVL